MTNHVEFPNKKDFLSIDKAIKIKCRYCDIVDTCHRRPHKEKYEEQGITTRCIITPNRPGAVRKKRKKKK